MNAKAPHKAASIAMTKKATKLHASGKVATAKSPASEAASQSARRGALALTHRKIKHAAERALAYRYERAARRSLLRRAALR